MMKPPSGKFPIIKICVLLFIVLLYAECFSSLSSSSIFKPCPTKSTKPKSNVLCWGCPKDDDDNKTQEVVPINASLWFHDGFVYDPEECDFTNGKWVFNSSIKPLYSDTTCPYISRPYSCVKNGRVDSDYRYWEWQPEYCTLPKFNPELALKKLQGKRLLFVGDSLQKSQWESFVCLVEWIIPENQKSMKRGTHSVFKAKEYNATIEFYWAPMLVESNTEFFTIRDPKKQIVKVDAIMDRAKNWTGVDILVFNSYVWWMSDTRVKALWGSFANGEEGYEELDAQIAYNLGLRTWANWVDSTIDPNKTQVFFTTMSPTHTRSADWSNNDGIKCFNETKPILGKKNHWGSGSNKGMKSVVEKVVKKMKVPVTFINITQISEYRIDAHSSVYTETGGKLLNEEEKANPRNADCIHWCLPGVPDTWNQMFLTML